MAIKKMANEKLYASLIMACIILWGTSCARWSATCPVPGLGKVDFIGRISFCTARCCGWSYATNKDSGGMDGKLSRASFLIVPDVDCRRATRRDEISGTSGKSVLSIAKRFHACLLCRAMHSPWDGRLRLWRMFVLLSRARERLWHSRARLPVASATAHAGLQQARLPGVVARWWKKRGRGAGDGCSGIFANTLPTRTCVQRPLRETGDVALYAEDQSASASDDRTEAEYINALLVSGSRELFARSWKPDGGRNAVEWESSRFSTSDTGTIPYHASYLAVDGLYMHHECFEMISTRVDCALKISFRRK